MSPLLQDAHQYIPMATISDHDIREGIGRFRVLIMGRANAGKTTILQKVCNTTDQPEIYNAKGDKINAAIVESSLGRGNHDITNEMVFRSSPVFVFHDSCGFEAGTAKEFESMKNFISERAHATELEDRIHAIWYCIPMDDHSRTFQRSEKFFLECDTGNAPVIAVFTKFDALRAVAYGDIKKQLQGVSAEERSKRIAQRVEELFTNTGVLEKLRKSENRARYISYVRLQYMNKQDTNCNTLLESTTLALDREELRLCLVSTQQSNLELCIKCAVTILVDRAHQLFGLLLVDYGAYQYKIARWFPHLQKEGEIKREDIIRILQPLAAKGSSVANQIIQTGIATIIVLEYSAFLPNYLGDLKRVESAVNYYLKSPTAVAVEKGAKEISRQGYDREELGKKILEFILENRLSKDLTERSR